MFKIRLLLLVLITVSGSAWALDEFAGITCAADIPKTLTGRREPNERVAATEQHHKELGLKNLGGSEISDRLFLASWQICGSEYELLVDSKTQLIRDVLAFPAHSLASPMFVGACQADGKDMPEVVLAVLNNSANYNARDRKQARTMLQATAAWKIDESRAKFAKQSTETLRCPLDGIITVDGGP
jgi:hypothetical protein